ncbi:MAG: PepSY domain-containing protein [Gammaproteobacteria bacterium]|nr:PepSY domain-containing protein [Gammaproteobacteria bacterium]NND59883.1 hypothetical protein [Gammaproteobacteria bacterium]
MKRIPGILLLALLCNAALMVPASAAPAGDVIQLAQQRFISLDKAVERVRRMVDGEVISAKTRYDNGRPVHYIKVYDRGRVRTFRVDAASGRIS